MNAQLCYFGGSGGFFALWHILLGTDYNCVLTNTNQSYYNIKGESWPAISDLPTSIHELSDEIQQELTDNQEWKLIVEQTIENRNNTPRSIDSKFYKPQWNVNQDRAKWKETEKWPTNHLTQKSSFKNKLFFNANPSFEDVIQDAALKILLYTDIETQTMLAKSKRAWAYSNNDTDESIKTTKFNGCNVYYQVDEIAKLTDYQVCLQDVVKTQGQSLLDIFNEKINKDNIFHNNMWLNLHTNEEKGRLLNES